MAAITTLLDDDIAAGVAPVSAPVVKTPLADPATEVNSAAEDHGFNEIDFAAKHADDPAAQDLAFQVHEKRANQGFKDATGKSFEHYKHSMTVGDVAHGFGSFVRGTAAAVPRLVKQGYQAATDSPDAATTTAENVIGAQMAGQNTERVLESLNLMPKTRPPEPTSMKSARAYLLSPEGKPNEEEFKQWEAAIPAYLAYLDEPGISGGSGDATVPGTLAKLKRGELGAVTPEEEAGLEAFKFRVKTGTPEVAQVNKEFASRGLRQDFEGLVKTTRDSMKLAGGTPLDEGLIANSIEGQSGGYKPSELYSPENLKSMGAAPVDPGAAAGVAAAVDPANVALLKVPALPGVRRIGGALTAGIGKTLETVAKPLGGGAAKVAGATAAGGAIYALAGGDVQRAAKIGAGVAAAVGLRKLGAFGQLLKEGGLEAASGGAKTSPLAASVAADVRAGKWALGGKAKLGAVNTVIDMAAMPAGAAPINALMSGGDQKTFWAMTAGAPLFGVFGALNGIKPQLVQAIRPQLQTEGATRFAAMAKGGDKWSQASGNYVQKLPEPQRNAVYELTAALGGLETQGPAGEKGVSEIVPLSAADYAAYKSENNLGAGDDRGVTLQNGKAYVNAEHASAADAGEFAHTAGHEFGGHVAMNILRAYSGKGGPLYDGVVNSIKNELGQTFPKTGTFVPNPEFKRFIDGYNAAIKAGKTKAAPLTTDAAIDEFIAETAGRIFSQKGTGDIVIPDGIRDKIQTAVGRFAGDTLGVGGRSNFGHEESAKVTGILTDTLRRLASPEARAALGADLPDSAPRGEVPLNENRQPDLVPNESIAAPPDTARADVAKALVKLGYNAADAKKAADTAAGKDASEMLASVLAAKQSAKTPAIAPAATKPAPLPAIAAKPATIAPQAALEPAIATISTPDAPTATVTKDAPRVESASSPIEPQGGTLRAGVEPAVTPEHEIETILKGVATAERLPRVFEIATKDAQGKPELFQRRVDEHGRETYGGRLDFSLPSHRAVLKELDISPEAEANLKQAAEASGAVKYVDYWSASKEAGKTEDITGKQRKTEYAADKEKKSRELLQKNKAIIFTGVTAWPSGKSVQRGISVDKFLANTKKLLDVAKEHNLGVDYTGINDPNILEDLQGYVDNHKNNFIGDGSRPVAGAAPAEGYEPYKIPRARFDLLNAAFHLETSTAQARFNERMAAYEAKKAGGAKARKPSVKKETLEDATGAQNLARENGWPVDPATGDTNPFRAYINAQGKIEHTNAAGEVRKGTGENLESVFEALSPDMIKTIHNAPEGETAIVRDVGFKGDAGQVLSKGLPNFRFAASGFMPSTSEGVTRGKEQDRAARSGSFSEGLPRKAQFMPDAKGGFYSQLERVADEKVKGRVTPEQLKATLKNNGVKDDELNWVLGDFLSGKKGAQITPQELKEAIAAGKVELKEVVKGDKGNENKRRITELENAVNTNPLPRLARDQGMSQLEAANLPAKLRDGRIEVSSLPEALQKEAQNFLDDYEKLSDARDESEGTTQQEGATKFAQYQLPGGPLSKDTEILTIRGWKPMPHVKVGDVVLTRKDNTGILEWQTVEATPTVYAETLYHFFNQSVDLMVTDAHQMLAKKARRSMRGEFRTTARDLWDTSECVIPLTGTWNGGKYGKIFDLDAGDVAEFMGWYISEGSCSVSSRNGNKTTITIAQCDKANPDNCKRIAALLDRLGFSWKRYTGAFAVHSRHMNKGLRMLVYSQGKSREKYIPPGFFQQPKKVIERLLEAMILGDGHKTEPHGNRKGGVSIFTNSECLAGGIQALAVLVGKRASVRLRPSGIYDIGILRKKWARVDDAKKSSSVPYNDTAYCVTVKNHAIYVRRNGVASFTGNSNYKELVYTLPETKRMSSLEREYKSLLSEYRTLEAANKNDPKLKEVGEKMRLNLRAQGGEGAPATFKSSHYDEPNVIFHTRVNDRVTADGQSMLFAEELQSDWGQSIRKKGVKSTEPIDTTGWKAEKAKNTELPWRPDDGQHWEVTKADGSRVAGISVDQAATPEEAIAKVAQIHADPTNRTGEPDMPFKGSGWKRLGIKKLLSKAVAEGKDSIGWTQGKEQIDRYEEVLRQNVDAIHYEPYTGEKGEQLYELLAYKNGKETFNEEDATIERINELLGKDIAAKITNNEGHDTKAEAPARDWRVLEGKDLSIGGQGMIGFYDRELVNIANDIGKKYGAKARLVEVPTKPREVDSAKARDRDFNPDEADFDPDEMEAAEDPNKSDTKQVWQLPITPALKAAVEAGQALFMPAAPQGKTPALQSTPRGTKSLPAFGGVTKREDKRLREPALAR